MGLLLTPMDVVPGCQCLSTCRLFLQFHKLLTSSYLIYSWLMLGSGKAAPAPGMSHDLNTRKCHREEALQVFCLWGVRNWVFYRKKSQGLLGHCEKFQPKRRSRQDQWDHLLATKLFSQTPLQQGVATDWNLSDRVWAEVMCVTSRTKPAKKQLEPPPPSPPPPPSESREQARETNAVHVRQKEFHPLIVIWREWEGPGTPVLNYLWLKLQLYYIWASIPLGAYLL